MSERVRGLIGFDQPWKTWKCTHVEVTIAPVAMGADEGGLSDVNSWMSGGGFSLLVVNVDMTEKGSIVAFPPTWCCRKPALHVLSFAENDLRLQ